ncbi:hypothetical protein KAM644c_40290 [Klebsiella quasipneumoniae subsp. quasipneumoniae]|uniref:LysR substrate-binding domain-containing protein n=1 Tax=Klebsiella quasipneumoniae subsp. quasipneumoniae TaxID=1667327 RepID=A0AAN2CF78_9ENTR|nr:hypothetical protein KAM644c_40290 [Klebsiella quasipneumoniae subsp. quasipneumoniae]
MLPHASPAAAYPAELYHQRTPVRVPADFASTLRQRGITMENTIELWSIESIKQCVAGNLGVSFLPRFAVEEELKRGTLVELPFSETPLTIHALCAHHAGKAISPAMRVFMQCMQEEQEAR